MAQRWNEIQRIFDQALKRKLEERPAFLAEACGVDAHLRAEIESLLANHQEAETGFLQPGDPGATVEGPGDPGSADSLIGKRIGGFRIMSVLGSGGMGTVYLAMQDEPRRHVALKLMKHGIASRSALRRFKFEAQLLARLRHPGIAQIYQSGTHDDGTGAVPYFAIEYIPGALSLTAYAKEKKLGIHQRLELFAVVCDAVAHGHQKGIIHRDLKPDNILVDSHGQPKIIDFGVARATDSDLTVTTLQTDLRQIIGTLQYMSPEQCGNDALDIDTSSDVYSLGVVLYELVCDQLPYDISDSLLPAAVEMIRTKDPVRPSTINRALKGDVETIALKALEKERERRYRSAADLGDDIRRYLKDEPIVARPPSVIYQIRLFSRRHKVVFRAIAAVFTVLVVATIVSTIFGIQAHIAKQDAVEASNQAKLEQIKAVAEAEQRRIAEQKALDAAEAAKEEAEGRRIAEEAELRAAEDSDLARKQAERERDEAERQAYNLNVRAAASALQRHDLQTAQRRLMQAPKRRRNWEWSLLLNRTDQSLVTCRGHTELITFLEYTLDGAHVVTRSHDRTVRVWNTATGDIVTTLGGRRQGQATTLCVALDSRAATIAAGTGQRTIKLWKVPSGEELATLRGHTKGVTAVAFSPDGKLLASGSDDATIRLWDLTTLSALTTLRGHTAGVSALQFTPDGGVLASGSKHGIIKLWNVAARKEYTTLNGSQHEIKRIKFSPDGERLVSVAEWHGGSVELWNVSESMKIATLEGSAGANGDVAMSTDGRIIALCSGNAVTIWDTVSGEKLSTFEGHDADVSSVAFDPRGTHVVSGSWDNTVRIWDVASRQLTDTLVGHIGRVNLVAFSPTGARIASAGSEDKTVKLWEGRPLQDPTVGKGHEASVRTVAISPSSTRIASGSQDSTVRLWNGITGKQLACLRGGYGWVHSVAFSPDGTRLAAVSSGSAISALQGRYTKNALMIWDARTGEEIVARRNFGRWPRATLHAISFSPNGTYLAVAGGGLTAVLDASTLDEIVTLSPTHTSLAFGPQSHRIACTGTDHAIRIWDLATGALVSELQSEDLLLCVAFSPDGRYLAAGSRDNTIRLWDTTSATQVRVMKGHMGFVASIAFSPDGARLVSAGTAGTVRIWDVPTGEELMILSGHELEEDPSLRRVRAHRASAANAVTFSPDGALIAAAGGGRTIRIWSSHLRRERLRQRTQADTAKAMANPILQELVGKSLPPERVAAGITADDIPPNVRDAAIDLMLEQYDSWREQATRVVDELFARLVTSDAVKEHLLSNSGLQQPILETALRLVAKRGEEPQRLAEDAWALVRDPTRDPSEYRHALRGATAAHNKAPDEASYLTVLGAGHYRLGQYREALEALLESRRLDPHLPTTSAFIAMAHHRLRNRAEAEGELSRLTDYMRRNAPSDVISNQTFRVSGAKPFVDEAIALISDPANN